tara:strand:+ start:2473 stop:2724 length:252 start_codon:yes stop_codon:yes gene_type:complete
MEDRKPENPNAFPTMEHGFDRVGSPTVSTYEGMTLRDYFAAKAMQALMSMEEKEEYDCIEDAWIKISKYSYDVADAMLNQREI